MTYQTNGQHFSLGYVASVPSGATPTPIVFGLLKDVSIDWTTALKELYGSWRYPVDAGYGESKITGKIGSASIFGSTLNAILGGSSAAGVTVGEPGQIATIPGTPFQITVTHAATFVEDHGVLNLTTGVQMTRGAAAAAGVYTVAAGVYTFDTSDAADVVCISYSYTIAAPTGKTQTITNAYQGIAPKVSLVCFGPGDTNNILGFKFPAVVIPKLSFGLKAGEWMTTGMDFTVIQSAPGATVAEAYTGV